MKTTEALYPIREVSNLTGVNAITLRAWERRYGLIEPVRTEGGHRLYTLEHIERIKAAVKLTEEGIPIGQVKARLAQAAPKISEGIELGDYDYHTKIMDAISEFDLDSLNTELDQAFMDIGESLLFSMISRVTQELSSASPDTHTTAQTAFWASQVLPRLYTRLRFATRHQPLHASKRVWMQSTQIEGSQGVHNTQISCVLAAIILAEKGMYAIISPTPEFDHQALFKNIKATQCQGLVIVDGQNGVNGFDESRWQEWVEAHPGLEFHYFVEDADKLDLGKKLQCYSYDLY